MAIPKYKINDLVYLNTSAQTGRLESYKISSIHDKGLGKYIYQFIIHQHPFAEATVADRINLKTTSEMFYTEDELLTGCEAMAIALNALDNQFSRVALRRDACGTTDAEELVTRRTPTEVLSPRFTVDDIVWIRQSAKIGFMEFYKITNVNRVPNSRHWKYELNIRGDLRDRDFYGNLTLGFNKTNTQRLIFNESELITECEAIDLAIAYLNRKISDMAADYAAVCQ